MKVALVTGASTGIGLETAKLLSGHYIVLAGVRKESDYEKLSNINKNIRPVFLDVTKISEIQETKTYIQKETDGLDLLVCNAGVAIGGPVETLSDSSWRDIFDVNLFGLVAITRELLPSLRKKKGRVINISSISGLVASPFLSSYCASKFAVEAFSDSLRRELLGTGVDVVVIQPGSVQTPIWDQAIVNSEKNFDRLSTETKEVYSKKIDSFRSVLRSSLKTAISPQAVASLVLQAAQSPSPKSRYMISTQNSMVRLIGLLPSRWADYLIAKSR